MKPEPTRELRAQHPPWTHAPLGGILIAAVLDVISAIDGGSHAWARDMYRAATFVLMIATSVMNTRIPTATILALHEERGLSTAQIVELYPGLGPAAAEDAYELEKRLRGIEPERHAA
ncbi:MAG: hypothetical protein ACRD1K_01075 [Acidimicrobiales bacterium]